MFDNLYENIGDKIKNLAKWLFLIESIGAVITGLVFLVDGPDLMFSGLLILLCGPVVAWVLSWPLYAFGELAEDIHAMRTNGQPCETRQPDAKKSVATSAAFLSKNKTSENVVSKEVDEEEDSSDQSIDNIWEKAVIAQGSLVGNCEMCGAKKQTLVNAEFKDLFGYAEKHLCNKCFCKYKAVPKK